MTQAVQVAQYGSNNVGLSFKNRIINGDMRIDQRNAGAAITPSSGAAFSVDRWVIETTRTGSLTLQRTTDAPAGFTNSLKVTVASSVASLSAGDAVNLLQGIEGYNFADLGWGTSTAQPITVSFWVKSSITGTYSVFTRSSSDTRCYVSTYTINQANTWEYKTVTITGDTTSFAYDTTNGRAILLGFALGDGSNFETTANTWTGTGAKMQVTGTVDFVSQANGATFYITGVQLEKGSVATSFDYRPYGTELQLCQRYYWQSFQGQTPSGWGANFIQSSGLQGTTSTGMLIGQFQHPVFMRASPTGSVWDHLGVAGKTSSFNPNSANYGGESGTIAYTSPQGYFLMRITGNASSCIGAYVALTAEL